MTTIRVQLEARFWAKVDRRGADDCWEWTAASASNDGYGGFSVDGKTRRAHRVSWELTHGPIPAGLYVLHTCDNPPCVNPHHLFLGTNADNLRDRDQKGRGWIPRGESHGSAKLKADDVREIRAANGKTVRGLAAEYGVSPAAIQRIRDGQGWRSVQ